MKYLQIIPLLLISTVILAATEERTVKVESIGGRLRFTLERTEIATFKFTDVKEEKSIPSLKIRYRNKEQKIDYISVTNDQGEVSIPVIWTFQQYDVLEKANGEIDVESLIPEELIGPTGTLFTRENKKWIKCKLPHEDRENSPILVEFIDWGETN